MSADPTEPLGRLQRDVRRLKLAAAALGVSLAAVLLAGAVFEEGGKRSFAEIDVERINVVEKDGKPRLIISNRASFPKELIIDGGVKVRHERDTSGMLFFNEQGECGGLSFGSDQEGGKYAAGSGLFLDKYKQDQVVGLSYSDDNGELFAGLSVWDRPDRPISEMVPRVEAARALADGPEKDAAFAAISDDFPTARRVTVGRVTDGSASVTLADAASKPRLRLSVKPGGEAAIEFLAQDGQVTRRIGPADAP